MSDRLYRALQSLVLVLLGLFLLNKLLDGSVFWYINARFLPLTLIGALGLIWLARTLLAELQPGSPAGHAPLGYPPHSHPHRSPAGLLILLLPFLLGVLVPARPLGASAVASKGLLTVPPRRAADAPARPVLEMAPTDRSVLDWLRAFALEPDPARFAGQPADLVGFVYHDPRLRPGQFLLARFTLACCAADASAISLIVAWPEAGRLPTDAWVRVRGTVQVGQLKAQVVPRIEAEAVERIAEPAQPYLFN